MTATTYTQEVSYAPARRYGRTIQVLHWATVLLLIGSFAVAWSIDDNGPAAQTAVLVMVHRSIGVTVLTLTLIRLLWRSMTPQPPLPDDIPWLQRLAAKANIVGLYGLLILQPLLGLTASWAHDDPIRVFGNVRIPPLIPKNIALGKQLSHWHGIVGLCLLALIGLHVAAALYHGFIRRDGVLQAMLPGRLKRA